MASLAQTDRQYAAHNVSVTPTALAKTLRKAERGLVRAALAATPKSATVTTRAGTGKAGKLACVAATPRFQVRSETAHRLTTIDSMVRELAIKHKNLNGMPLDLLAIQFGVRPRSIEAMIRRNADCHTLRIHRARVKLSTQDTLDLIDQQKQSRV